MTWNSPRKNYCFKNLILLAIVSNCLPTNSSECPRECNQLSVFRSISTLARIALDKPRGLLECALCNKIQLMVHDRAEFQSRKNLVVIIVRLYQRYSRDYVAQVCVCVLVLRPCDGWKYKLDHITNYEHSTTHWGTSFFSMSDPIWNRTCICPLFESFHFEANEIDPANHKIWIVPLRQFRIDVFFPTLEMCSKHAMDFPFSQCVCCVRAFQH